jgi:putative DNA methylase
MSNPKYRKKLIEVALPLEAINRESAREKSIRHGHPSTLHLWWARRPLAACRAVLFAQLVDDPSAHPDRFPTEEDQTRERERLFRIIEEMVKWENINNEKVLEAARTEILKSTDGNLPSVLDPFCGGGSIPLEAQRLGLKAYASDLNPVAVLITKALIEIPPKFAGLPPVHPIYTGEQTSSHWKGAQGLAEDVRYYGKWMRDEAKKRIGHLYPKVKLPKEQGGGEATVIAWLWARTVKCPNPVCGAQMPLVRSFSLSTKKGKQAWVEPIVTGNQYYFEVRTGQGKPREGTVSRTGARCLCCNTPVPLSHVRSEGKAGRMGQRLMAIVAEGARGRVYVSPDEEHAKIANSAEPTWRPDGELQGKCRVSVPLYGMNTFADLFTPRQLVALTTFSDLVMEAREQVLEDAVKAGMTDDGKGISDGGMGVTAYADAVATYLAFAVSKAANLGSTICSWMNDRGALRETFARQAIPMVWDFAEANPFSGSGGNLEMFLDRIAEVISFTPSGTVGSSRQLDAIAAIHCFKDIIVSTDPPYYDNIGYADLSDFFYVWLRRSMGNIFPDLFSTLLVPKAQELAATPYRFEGDREKAKDFFEKGLKNTFQAMRHSAAPEYPISVYYAFKQAKTDNGVEDRYKNNSLTSTGWQTMLEGLLSSRFQITGTWPMRTESPGRAVALGTNALASSIILACRPRPEGSSMTTRRDFINSLKAELPKALKTLQQGNIAPVDLAQSAIGPGMAVFSRYSKVLEADGAPMTVRSALALINQVLDEYLAEQEGEYDADTRWALAWFEQFGVNEGPFGVAETLSKAKNSAVDALMKAGILISKAGKVRLLRRDELPNDWDPVKDKRITVWEVTQQLIKALVDKGSEEAAADLLQKVGALGDVTRELAYRLYTICDRKKWAQEALAYNSLVVAWPELVKLAGRGKTKKQTQREMFTQS